MSNIVSEMLKIIRSREHNEVVIYQQMHERVALSTLSATPYTEIVQFTFKCNPFFETHV